MVASLMTTRDILVRLGHDVEYHGASRERAERQSKYVIELEEMFDLDIAWIFYRRIYRRLQELYGFDKMYHSVRERMEALRQYYATLDEIAVEDWHKDKEVAAANREVAAARLAFAAAVLAAAIIGLGVWALPPTTDKGVGAIWGAIAFAAGMVVLAVVGGNWGRWKRALKRHSASP
jgi:hypothetical protein